MAEPTPVYGTIPPAIQRLPGRIALTGINHGLSATGATNAVPLNTSPSYTYVLDVAIGSDFLNPLLIAVDEANNYVIHIMGVSDTGTFTMVISKVGLVVSDTLISSAGTVPTFDTGSPTGFIILYDAALPPTPQLFRLYLNILQLS